MNVNNSALHSLTENLQVLQMKEIPGDNVETIMSYLKGSLLMLTKCDKFPTDMIGLLKDIFCSVECK